MRILLVRHGQNLANVTREFSYKKVDYSLTELGREQAMHTGLYLAGQDVSVVASSPLKRAIETAQALTQHTGHEIHIIEGFRELNPGDLEGQPPTDEAWRLYDSIMEAWLHGNSDASMPGGEDYHSLERRVREALEETARVPGGRTRVIAAHGGTVFAAVKVLVPDADIVGLWASGVPNCSITEFEVEEHRGRLHGQLVRFGDNSHIPGAQPGW